MPTFALICFDKPDSLALRMATREAHLAYMGQVADSLKYGGPLLDEAGNMNGSLIILEATDLAAARAVNAADPYQLAGLFERVEVRSLRPVLGQKA